MTPRFIAAMLFSSICAGCFDAEPHSLLSHNPSAKIPAIKDAVSQHDDKAVPQLVEDLSSDDPAVRFYAIEGLHRLTGQTMGYHYYEDAPKRRPAVMKWKHWLHDELNGELNGQSHGASTAMSPGP
jgi:hypothetical protein